MMFSRTLATASACHCWSRLQVSSQQKQIIKASNGIQWPQRYCMWRTLFGPQWCQKRRPRRQLCNPRKPRNPGERKNLIVSYSFLLSTRICPLNELLITHCFSDQTLAYLDISWHPVRQAAEFGHAKPGTASKAESFAAFMSWPVAHCSGENGWEWCLKRIQTGPSPSQQDATRDLNKTCDWENQQSSCAFAAAPEGALAPNQLKSPWRQLDLSGQWIRAMGMPLFTTWATTLYLVWGKERRLEEPPYIALHRWQFCSILRNMFLVLMSFSNAVMLSPSISLPPTSKFE